jgi:GAF domain-containing protein
VKRRGDVQGKEARVKRPAAPRRRPLPKAGQGNGKSRTGDPNPQRQLGQLEQLDLRTRELREMREQQIATAKVLQVISSSSGELKPVFESILENAVRLCEASFGNLLLYENKAFRHVALHNAPKAWAAEQRRDPVAPRRSARFLYRVADTKQVAHIADITSKNPDEPIAKVAGARTLLIVPMLQEKELIGVIAIYRREVRPFNDRQIELVKNFAAQAVIAIENARLFEAEQQRARELSESLEQQTATSEVLKVISSSRGELEPVFRVVLESAVRICGAKFGNLWLREGDVFRIGATHGAPPAYADFLRREPLLRPVPGTALGRAAATRRAVQISDVRMEKGYAGSGAIHVGPVKHAGARTVFAVPMLKGDELVGIIIIYRQEVRPFTDKQIDLVKNFAAQAVIAIENARLLNELRQRTDDLSESLQQQTATSEVLSVISSSAGELRPVFETMLAKAVELCEAKFGAMWMVDGEGYRTAALHGDLPEAYVEQWRSGTLHRPKSAVPMVRAIRSRKPVHVPDMLKEKAYLEGDPLPVSVVKIAGIRAIVTVPMLKEGEAIGVVTIYRKEARPFTGKQIELVSNFAKQAVIAIENARLLNELRQRTDDLSESLEQQTATSEVLKVISSSPGELEPVFQAMLEKAVRICDANFGNLYRREGDAFRIGATYGASPAYVEFVRTEQLFHLNPKVGLGRLVRTKELYHVADIAAAPTHGDRLREATIKLAGARTLIALPMLKDNEVIGAIVIYRQEVRPFTEKQIDLVKNFAAQAVIAIENARLLSELRQRTGDLTDSLEQQTATSEVLKAISSSPGELAPVFQAMLENAVRICEAKIGILFRYADGAYSAVSLLGVSPEYAEYLNRGPIRPGPTAGLARLVKSKQTIQIADARADRAYADLEPLRVATVDLGGARSLLNVPMLKEGELIGAIGIYRQEVRPFTEKQVELVTNFAAQAVIAIENTRLLNELRQRTDDLTESLEQQTATSEVLSVISSSVTDAQPVFEIIARSAARACDARLCHVFRFDGELIHFAATHGYEGEAIEALRRAYPIPPGRQSAVARAILNVAIEQIPDVQADPEYRHGGTAKEANFRSIVAVPMLKAGRPVGAIAIARAQTGYFPERQIELLRTFADQAVIAIENARLLNELRQRTDDLSESLQQQTATSEVLKVISRSAFNLQPVLDSIVQTASQLCEAYDAVILLRQNERLYVKAHHGPIPVDFSDFPIGRDWVTGRAFVDRAPVHIHDLQQSAQEFPDGAEMALRLGHRTILAVPLLREDEAIGAIAIRRIEAKPFTDKQIELVRTFADQAVIAIENVRLFEEVQARTAELTVSLEQQTATSDVLQILSSSQGELQPVFDALLANATRLCAAKFGTLFLREGDDFRVVAQHNTPAALAELRRKDPIVRAGPGTAIRRSTTAKQAIQVPDIRTEPAYSERDPDRIALVELGGYRAVLSVPMLKDNAVIGAINIYRQDAGAFPDKQVELVKNFAAQAVIAIENTRLLSELRQSLDQQTATADVLKVISRSAFDVQAVLNTLVESAGRLCHSENVQIFLRDADVYRLAAHNGFSPEYQEYVKQHPIAPGRGSLVARTAEEVATVHIPDVLADPEYTWLEGQKLGGSRAGLGVPLLREGNCIGVMAMTKLVPQPFTDKQIEIVSTFADQAVIAIENVRLFDEVQARTAELTESLQQQTATADVLKVISRSTFDLQAVLDTLTESAARLCDANRAAIMRQKGAAYYYATHYNFPPEFVEFTKTVGLEPGRGTCAGRVLQTGKIVQIPDALADPEYTLLEGRRLGDYRTILGVPLLREGTPIGLILLLRPDVRPFTNKEIDLVTTFADQAVIAIENVRLFEDVEARTRELAKSLQDLRAAQDRLVQTEKLASLGQLTAGIAHEIKNPLNFVNNFSAVSAELIDEIGEALEGAKLDGKAGAQLTELMDMLRGNLEKVVQHGKRADSIVKNMLLHSRQGSGEHRPVDINAVVEESLNLAYHGARAEKQGFNITLQRSFDPAAGEADLFPQEITRVLLNLISNGFYAATKRKALDGADGYEPTLAAATKSLGDSVEIRIRDNGSGIPPEVRERMFNPFFTTKPAGEGTGLGLSISYDIIVKQHGGSIDVDTEPGEYTEFRIVLPRQAATLAKTGALT